MTITSPADYVTHPSGTVHLWSAATYFPLDDDPPRTLCGIAIGFEADGWAWGDETLSGHVATCQRCRAIFRPWEKLLRDAP